MIKQLVLKIASRCNLNCTYCYMYNAGDLTYKQQPKVMSRERVVACLKRTRDYCLLTGLDSMSFVFHGGEPLLAGKDFFLAFKELADNLLVTAGIKYGITMQTNGVLIDGAWSKFLADQSIDTGVSIDGTEEVHDSRRVYHSGKGTFKDVLEGISFLGYYNPRKVITVIDTESNVQEFYAFIKSLRVVRMNLQIVYANHDKPPMGIANYAEDEMTVVADWLIQLFDEWMGDADARPGINLFEQILALILGNKRAGNDILGEKECDLLIIETDGSIEPSGSLKLCGHGFTKQGLNINSHRLEDVFDNLLLRTYKLSHQANLPGKCRQCPVKEVCGGGPLASRYSTLNGFNNSSVYCKDLMKLITYIQNAVLDLFPSSAGIHSHIGRLTYRAARQAISSI